MRLAAAAAGSSGSSDGSATAQQDVQQQEAAAAESAAASEQQQLRQLKPWRVMLVRCWTLLQRSLWPILVAHGITDAVVFLLHRLSHRLTNETAVALLGGGMLTPAAIGNMWWLSVDPAIANFQTGYQPLTFVFFLLAFPINVFIKTWASLATILLCQRAQEQAQQQPEGDATAAAKDAQDAEPAAWWQPVLGLKHALGSLRALQPQILALWRPVFVAELMVAAVVVPLQFASLAVVTLPLTLPWILDLQAAAPAAAAEGVRGMAAVKRSRHLLRPLRWQLAIPFVALLLTGRLLEAAKATLINALPARFYTQLIEIPLVILLGGTAVSVLLSRMQDVLPFVAYTEGVALEAAAAAQNGSGEQGAQQGSSDNVGAEDGGGDSGS